MLISCYPPFTHVSPFCMPHANAENADVGVNSFSRKLILGIVIAWRVVWIRERYAMNWATSSAFKHHWQHTKIHIIPLAVCVCVCVWAKCPCACDTAWMAFRVLEQFNYVPLLAHFIRDGFRADVSSEMWASTYNYYHRFVEWFNKLLCMLCIAFIYANLSFINVFCLPSPPSVSAFPSLLSATFWRISHSRTYLIYKFPLFSNEFRNQGCNWKMSFRLKWMSTWCWHADFAGTSLRPLCIRTSWRECTKFCANIFYKSDESVVNTVANQHR